jgi:hypothetical protein
VRLSTVNTTFPRSSELYAVYSSIGASKPSRRNAFAWLFIAPDEWALEDSRFRKLNVAAEIVSVQDRSMDIALSFTASGHGVS